MDIASQCDRYYCIIDFVGLQMRQSQEIVLAAQQTGRMQVLSDIVNAFTEAGI